MEMSFLIKIFNSKLPAINEHLSINYQCKQTKYVGPNNQKITLLLKICPWFPSTTPGLLSLAALIAIPSTAPIVNRRGCLWISFGSSTDFSFNVLHGFLAPVAWVAGLCASVVGSGLLPATAAVAGLRETESNSPVVNDGCDWMLAAAELGRSLLFFFDDAGSRSGGMVRASSSWSSAFVIYLSLSSALVQRVNTLSSRLWLNKPPSACLWTPLKV